VAEVKSFGHPTFTIRGSAFAVIDRYAGRDCLWLRIDPMNRAEFLKIPGWFASPYDPKSLALCCELDRFDWRRLGRLLRLSYQLTGIESTTLATP
jgi:hypothetical protein